MQLAAASHVGLVRKINQDGYLVRQESSGAYVVCVADGMGGHVAGEVASALALSTLWEVLCDQAAETDQSARLQAAIQAANEKIHQQANGSEVYTGMGTTIVAAVADSTYIWIAHVGDSRAYLWRKSGDLTQLTEDHSLVNELVRRGQIRPEEALTHPQRHMLTRALGTLPDVVIESRQVSWNRGDILLICSDGLTTHVSDDQVQEFLAGDSALQAKLDVLVQTALEKGGHDNVTVAALFNDEGAQRGNAS